MLTIALFYPKNAYIAICTGLHGSLPHFKIMLHEISAKFLKYKSLENFLLKQYPSLIEDIITSELQWTTLIIKIPNNAHHH